MPAGDDRHGAGRGIPGRAAFRGEVACAVSSRPILREALVATGFAYDARDLDANVSGELRRMLAASRGLRRCGSAALDLCLVADGTYDFYWERGLAPWDMAGGAAIVLAAGGRLSAMDGGVGRPLEGSLAASNGLVHEAAPAEEAKPDRIRPFELRSQLEYWLRVCMRTAGADLRHTAAAQEWQNATHHTTARIGLE